MIKNQSLVSRLTIWFSSSAFLLILISTITLYWSLLSTLNNEDDLFITDKVQTVTRLLEVSGTNFKSIKDRVEKEWVGRKFERVYVKVLDGHGKTITETPGFENISKIIFKNAPIFNFEQNLRSAQKVELKSGQIFKVEIVKTTLANAHSEERVIQIALDRTSEENFLDAYRSRILLMLFITLIISSIIGYRIAVRGIQPIFDIVQVVKKTSSTTLHEKINLDNIPSELTTLTETFNDMLDRLNDSFERISRFSSDIAHDLRTPINNFRGELEVALGRPRSVAEYNNVLSSCLEESDRISRLIDGLLFLSRSENPQAQLSIEEIHVRDEVSRLIEFYEASILEKGIKLYFHVPDIILFADRLLFQRAVGNILSNAIHYTDGSGSITISADTNESFLRLEIDDTGLGIPKEDLNKVFDRFYRVDSARSEKHGGSGLGLSIVQSIMNLHRGNIEIKSELGVGTKATLTFPKV